MKGVRQVVLLCTALLCPAGRLAADNVRGPLTQIVQLSEQHPETAPLAVAMEEIIAIDPGTEHRFFTAIEIELELPEVLQEYGDSFALYIYEGVSPAPKPGLATYRATRLLVAQVRFRRKLFIEIPLPNGRPSAAAPDTVTYDGPPGRVRYPLLATVLPIIKGVPSSLYDTPFPVTVRLVPADLGALALRVAAPDGNLPPGLEVKLDGKPIQDIGSERLLKPGIYTVEAAAPGYRSVSRSVMVGRARVSPIELTLEPVSSAVVAIEAPGSAVVYLDGERIDHGPAADHRVTEGTHSVVMRLDEYRITRTFQAVAGKSYKITLFLDLTVEER
jgi:hypothetical protein